MHWPAVNYLAVFVAAIVIFAIGGLWYSPALFAKKWVSLQGKTEAEMRAAAAGSGPGMYVIAFLCALVTAWAMAVLVNSFAPLAPTPPAGEWAWRGVKLGVFCWFGFVAPTSLAMATFYMKPKQLWAIDAGYNLVSFIFAGMVLMLWR